MERRRCVVFIHKQTEVQVGRYPQSKFENYQLYIFSLSYKGRHRKRPELPPVQSYPALPLKRIDLAIKA